MVLYGLCTATDSMSMMNEQKLTKNRTKANSKRKKNNRFNIRDIFLPIETKCLLQPEREKEFCLCTLQAHFLFCNKLRDGIFDGEWKKEDERKLYLASSADSAFQHTTKFTLRTNSNVIIIIATIHANLSVSISMAIKWAH